MLRSDLAQPGRDGHDRDGLLGDDAEQEGSVLEAPDLAQRAQVDVGVVLLGQRDNVDDRERGRVGQRARDDGKHHWEQASAVALLHCHARGAVAANAVGKVPRLGVDVGLGCSTSLRLRSRGSIKHESGKLAGAAQP